MTTGDPLRAAARRRPDAPAFDDGRRVLDYRALDRRVDDCAARIGGLGAGRARRLAAVLETGIELVTLLHAAPRAGLVLAPLSPRLTAHELSAALDALDPEAVACGSETVAAVREGAAGRRILLAGGDPVPDGGAAEGAGSGGEEAGPGPVPLAALEPSGEELGALSLDEVRYVLWTSGTSGRPRGVRLTGRSLAASARASRRRLDLSPDDRWLASLSPAHVGGLALVTRAAHLGATLVARAGAEVAELSDLAEAGSVTHASLVPVLLRRLLEHRQGREAPSALRCLLVGGARTPEPLVRRALEAGYPVALTYGMTETTSQVATAPPERVRRKPDSVGRPLSGVEVRIARDGEIRVRGLTLAEGYLGGEPLDTDREGWLRTGDLGRLDEDGDLRVTGRRVDRIVSGGVTIDAREVEEAVRGVDGVVDVAVVGIPDPEWGERVAALVVPGTGEEGDDALVERIQEAAARRLSAAKRPRRIRVADALPRTRTGKVDREGVRQLLLP